MEAQQLKRTLGFWTATSVVAGSIIGSGVFMKPATMAEQLGSPIWLTIVWILAGIFSLFGALIYAELGAMLPQTGGIYAYFRFMFGDFFAFLYGWSAFAVINTAAVAAISFVCAEYADFFLHLPRFNPDIEKSLPIHLPFIGDLFPLENFGVKSLAVFLVILFTFLNSRSVGGSNRFQLVSTFIKIALIAALILGIFFSGSGSVNNFFNSTTPESGLLNGIMLAMTGAFFAFDGWININSIAGEVKDPQKNIPRSLFVGVGICIVVYLLVNQAYLYVLPVEKMAGSALVASDAMAVAVGKTAEAIVAAMIVVSTLGAINGNAMTSARVTYAMGDDKTFFPWTGKLHPRFGTPSNALWLHAAWTSMFILTGSFNMLADMFVFITWIAYGVGAAGIFLLRKRRPDIERPYKIWGYPLVPILFMLFTGFYLVTTVYSDVYNYINHKQPIINSLLGLLLTLIGIPIYYLVKKKAIKE